MQESLAHKGSRVAKDFYKIKDLSKASNTENRTRGSSWSPKATLAPTKYY